MNTEAERLIETISSMRDEDLLRIVYFESDQYRPDALTYAKAEIKRRGIILERASPIIVGGPRPDLRLAAFGERIWRARRIIAFSLGCFGSLFWFAWANFGSYQKMHQAHCNDCLVFFGFPFYLYQTGGFAGPPSPFLWGGLIADVAIAVLVSASVGWLLKALTARFTVSSKAV